MNIAKGALIKEWFVGNRQIRRLLIPVLTGFHIVNLDEINDDSFYSLTWDNRTDVVIKEVKILEKTDDFAC